MSFGPCVGDFIVISGLATKAYSAYKHAPDGYRYISEEIAALQILVSKAAEHFRSTPLHSDDGHYGQKVLQGCQSVLQDLNSLIEKYRRQASTNKSIAFTGVKVGKENIVDLGERLISSTVLLHGFIRRFVVLGTIFYFINPVILISLF